LEPGKCGNFTIYKKQKGVSQRPIYSLLAINYVMAESDDRSAGVGSLSEAYRNSFSYSQTGNCRG